MVAARSVASVASVAGTLCATPTPAQGVDHDAAEQPRAAPERPVSPDATQEAAYKSYSRNVHISYDPSEGLVRMEVLATDLRLLKQQLVQLAPVRGVGEVSWATPLRRNGMTVPLDE